MRKRRKLRLSLWGKHIDDRNTANSLALHYRILSDSLEIFCTANKEEETVIQVRRSLCYWSTVSSY